MHSETIDDEIRSYLESSNVRELQDLVAIAEKANPLWLLLQRAYTLMLCLYRRLSRILDDAQTEYRLYTDEPLLVVLQRWRRLCTKFYHAETHRFSVSAVCSTPIHLERNQAHHSPTHSPTHVDTLCAHQIPTIYDYIKYDAAHNPHVLGQLGPRLVEAVKPLSDFIRPLPFTSFSSKSVTLAHKLVRPLQLQIYSHLQQAHDWWLERLNKQRSSSSSSSSSSNDKDGDDVPPTALSNLYFAGEAHIQALWTMILHNGVVPVLSTWREYAELNYMSHLVIQLVLHEKHPAGDGSPAAAITPDDLFFEISFSPGVIEDVLALAEGEHVLPVVTAFPVCFNLSLAQLKRMMVLE